ncbi:MAG: hypothetical protein HKO65_09525 [Gemmatimonadetes bacterium]|nr:hypothetical protein [Gemmatimonadota bacterium]NNM05331.1 hypothetical protein [Gemmatimonadota bacterium]
MYKIVFFLLILLGAALYFPQTRPVVVDTLEPVINPVFIWQTKGEMDRIVRELQTVIEQGSTLPDPGERFNRWMERQFFGGARTDAWGGPYTLQLIRDELLVVSNGPDKEVGTADDLTQLVMRQSRRGRR